jgi:hypothetical protein
VKKGTGVKKRYGCENRAVQENRAVPFKSYSKLITTNLKKLKNTLLDTT